MATLKGYKLILIVPDKMSREKIFHLKAMGAEVMLTRSDVGKGHPEYYQDMAERISKETGAFFVNQFGNPANPLAHETTTGPEIWEQMDHDVDAVVFGVGSSGTMTGLARYFAKASPQTEMVLADPVGSVLADYVHTGKYGEAGSWIVEGIGEDFIPPIADFSRVKKAYSISDEEACSTVRELLMKEGILAGSSSGTLLAAALRYCREQKSPKRVVTFVCDSGNKYLSKVFNDYWMIDQGFLKREQFGDLRDLITRRHDERATVTIASRRQADDRVCAHEALRHLAASGAGRRQGGRHYRRVGSAHRSTGKSGALQRPGAHGNDAADRHRRPENTAVTTYGIVQQGACCHRGGQGPVLRPDHPHGRLESSAQPRALTSSASIHRRGRGGRRG